MMLWQFTLHISSIYLNKIRYFKTRFSKLFLSLLLKLFLCVDYTFSFNWGMWSERHSVMSTSFCDSMDCSPPGSSVHGILQARVLEWVAIPFSRRSSWPRDRTWVSCTAGRFFTIWASRKAPLIDAWLTYNIILISRTQNNDSIFVYIVELYV